MDSLLKFDAEKFLDQYQELGFQSKDEMILASLHLLRRTLREEATAHLPE